MGGRRRRKLSRGQQCTKTATTTARYPEAKPNDGHSNASDPATSASDGVQRVAAARASGRGGGIGGRPGGVGDVVGGPRRGVGVGCPWATTGRTMIASSPIPMSRSIRPFRFLTARRARMHAMSAGPWEDRRCSRPCGECQLMFRVFGRLPVTDSATRPRAGVRKASGEETARGVCAGGGVGLWGFSVDVGPDPPVWNRDDG